MRVIQLIPGTADTFYCENCLRDHGLMRQLRALDHDVLMVPLYLPLVVNGEASEDDTPLFFGGINVYLQQRYSLFRRTPRWMDRLLDARGLLSWVSKQFGMTDARELGNTTISMLRGEAGHQVKELNRLVDWLVEQPRPDVIALSNILLIGAAHELKRRLGAPLVCMLQDEDEFLDELPGDLRRQCETLLAERAEQIDLFIAASEYYAAVAAERFRLPRARIRVVPNGLDVEAYPQARPPTPPVIGFLSRMHEDKGLDLLAEALIELKADPALHDVRTVIAGGQTVDDRPYVKRVRRRLDEAGIVDDVTFLPNLEHDQRLKFLASLSVMALPMRRGPAGAMAALEAMAAGVPVVAAAHGAFVDVLSKTEAGRLHEPGGATHLAAKPRAGLTDADAAAPMGASGREAAKRRHDLPAIAERLAECYASLLDSQTRDSTQGTA